MTNAGTDTQTVTGPIGVFDSGFGGLTVLRDIRRRLPGYDYLYLGDNARAPYGSRSFDTVYRFTLQAVTYLFDAGCPLVILACNTASAKALRTIQQNDLPQMADTTRRVLGVIRPTAEIVGTMTRTRHIGILGTPGTVASKSYDIEIAHLHPDCTVNAHACPMWVPLIENGEIDTPAADYFIERDVNALMALDPQIDTVVLGCTHYPLVADKIARILPHGVSLVPQGPVVADSLADYLTRHPEIDCRLSKNSTSRFMTTENPDGFDSAATIFVGHPVKASRIILPG